MKVILTGCTGFIGDEVLLQCRADPAITSIIALTRRALSEAVHADPKVQVVVIKDFNTYPEDVVKQLDGADACIWCMGTTAAVREVEIDYPLAFANAFAPTLAAQQKPFRYIHCSGRLAEKDQTKPLLFLQEGRRIKGIAELEMMAMEQKHELHGGRWVTFVAKPAMVLRKEGDVLKRLGGYAIGAVRVDDLAAP
ncbi:hypothetical protein B0H10DRAFT_2220325 [Mycena sp. CBHHK59/15]|nr:hypothetical protein B0H10DRAFT_2220325 [Mycena sp. CBHHK59/15]